MLHFDLQNVTTKKQDTHIILYNWLLTKAIVLAPLDEGSAHCTEEWIRYCTGIYHPTVSLWSRTSHLLGASAPLPISTPTIFFFACILFHISVLHFLPAPPLISMHYFPNVPYFPSQNPVELARAPFSSVYFPSHPSTFSSHVLTFPSALPSPIPSFFPVLHTCFVPHLFSQNSLGLARGLSSRVLPFLYPSLPHFPAKWLFCFLVFQMKCVFIALDLIFHWSNYCVFVNIFHSTFALLGLY